MFSDYDLDIYGYEDSDDDLDDEEFEPPFDCGYNPDTGLCSKAGSEDCDWECPYREALSN